HPSVLPLFGAAMEEGRVLMVSWLMANGDVGSYLRRTTGANKMKILFDIASGMQFLHSKHVVHADLKTKNVLVDDSGRAMIADFGFSKARDPSQS
ncbi:kinase-like protein, partial [Gonapodya prolifera JEL478]